MLRIDSQFHHEGLIIPQNVEFWHHWCRYLWRRFHLLAISGHFHNSCKLFLDFIHWFEFSLIWLGFTSLNSSNLQKNLRTSSHFCTLIHTFPSYILFRFYFFSPKLFSKTTINLQSFQKYNSFKISFLILLNTVHLQQIIWIKKFHNNFDNQLFHCNYQTKLYPIVFSRNEPRLLTHYWWEALHLAIVDSLSIRITVV